MSKRIGEVVTSTGGKWEVSASLGGVEIAGGAGIEPDDATALGRLLLDAAQEARVMRAKAEQSKALYIDVDDMMGALRCVASAEYSRDEVRDLAQRSLERLRQGLGA